MIGILIGIMSIVALIGLGEGLRVTINNQFGNFAPDLISASVGSGGGPPGTGDIIPFNEKDLKSVKNLKEIDRVAGRSIAFGKAEYNDKVAFGGAVSMPDGDSRNLVEYGLGLKTNKGRLLKDKDKRRIVVGSDFAKETTFDKQIVPGVNVKINDIDFEVIGVLEKKGSFMIDGIVIMNDNDFDEIFNREPNTYGIIAAQYKTETYSVEETQASIEKTLRRNRDVKEGEENFKVSTPQSTIENLNSTLFAVQLFVYIIAGISIVVGGIGIMTTMYTTVVERTKEIGIMKAIGAKNNIIFTLFFIESGFIGLAGGLAGVTLGAATAYGLAYIGKLALGSNLIQANVSLGLIIGSLLFSFILGSLFGTFPAIQAARMKPVDALRHVK